MRSKPTGSLIFSAKATDKPKLVSGHEGSASHFIAGEAARLFTLAAEAGSVEGLYSLGWMHAVGQGVPSNRSRAAELYRQAVEQAPDWRHAAPPFVALLLLPFLSAWQWLQPMSSAVFGLQAPGEQSSAGAVVKQTHLQAPVLS